MRKWEIWDFPIPSEDEPHPFVILSPNVICESKRMIAVNGLMCVSLRPPKKAELHEVVLNGMDGLEHKTLVNCALVYSLNKTTVIPQSCRGIVSSERRRKILHLVKQVLDAP